MTSIKMKGACIITAKALHRKKIGSNIWYTQDFTKTKKIRWSLKLGVTYMGNRKLVAISNRYKLRIGTGFIVWYIVQIRREVVYGSCIRYPRGLVGIDQSSSGHGGEFSKWVPPLICVIHPLVIVDWCVPRFVTNLTCWTRAGFGFQDWGFWGLLKLPLPLL